MIIPKSITVNGFVWQVQFDGPLTDESNVYGSAHYKSQTIYIDPKVPRQKQEQTFLHELLHAVSWQSGLSKRMQQAKQTELEEEIITALSFGLYQALNDNGLLLPDDVRSADTEKETQ